MTRKLALGREGPSEKRVPLLLSLLLVLLLLVLTLHRRDLLTVWLPIHLMRRWLCMSSGLQLRR